MIFDRLHTLSSSTLRELCYLGIPPPIRSKIWSYLLGNDLHITPQLYEMFKSRALSIIHLNTHKDDSTEGCDSIPLPPSQTPTCRPLLQGKEDSISIIQYDIPRTYSTFDLSSISPHYTQISSTLTTILQTYACYRPDIGYIQGMNYIAAMCVHYFDEYHAFCIFANLINRQIHFNLFLLDPNIVKSFSMVFDHLFQKYLPQLYQHLLTESISSEIFLLDWALTLFSKAMPINVAARLWDVYLLEGEIFFIKACLGIYLSMFISPSYVIRNSGDV